MHTHTLAHSHFSRTLSHNPSVTITPSLTLSFHKLTLPLTPSLLPSTQLLSGHFISLILLSPPLTPSLNLTPLLSLSPHQILSLSASLFRVSHSLSPYAHLSHSFAVHLPLTSFVFLDLLPTLYPSLSPPICLPLSHHSSLFPVGPSPPFLLPMSSHLV